MAGDDECEAAAQRCREADDLLRPPLQEQVVSRADRYDGAEVIERDVPVALDVVYVEATGHSSAHTAEAVAVLNEAIPARAPPVSICLGGLMAVSMNDAEVPTIVASERVVVAARVGERLLAVLELPAGRRADPRLTGVPTPGVVATLPRAESATALVRVAVEAGSALHTGNSGP